MSDDDGPTASLIIFFLLLITEIFFYGFGAAIQALNEKDVERKAQEEKDRKSVRLLHIMKDPTRYVNTVQLVVTLCNVVMGGWFLSFFFIRISRIFEEIGESWLPELMPGAAAAVGIVSMVLTMALLLYIVLTFGV